MKYNFTKFDDKGLGRGSGSYKGGLSVSKTKQVWIMERNFPRYEKIDIFVDYENNAIKIVEGSTYKIVLSRRGIRGKRTQAFSGSSLVNCGVKVGHYKYIGENTFVLEIENELKPNITS